MLFQALDLCCAAGLTDPGTPAAFRLGHFLERLSQLDLAGELLHQLAPVGADPAPVAHQHNAAE
jgi:hypothetical protein